METIGDLIKKRKEKLLSETLKSGPISELMKMVDAEMVKWNVPYKEKVMVEFNEYSYWILHLARPYRIPDEPDPAGYTVRSVVEKYREELLKTEAYNLTTYNKILSFKGLNTKDTHYKGLAYKIKQYYPEFKIPDEVWAATNERLREYGNSCRVLADIIMGLRDKIDASHVRRVTGREEDAEHVPPRENKKHWRKYNG